MKLPLPSFQVWVALGLGLLSACRSLPNSPSLTSVEKKPSQSDTLFFRVDSLAGRWWFVGPTGQPYLALGANHTGGFLTDSSQAMPYLARFGGSLTQARQTILQTYLRLGYNAGEAYAPLDPYLRRNLPYIAHLEYPERDYRRMDIFDPAVQNALFQHTVARCLPLRTDSLVIGIAFVDLPVWNSRRVDAFRAMPTQAPGKQRYVAFLRNRYDNIERLNEIYHTQFKSFEALTAETGWAIPNPNPAVNEDDAQFMALIADLWYSTLQRAVRQAAPNHLFLGERHQLRATPDPVLRVVGKYVDVFLTQALIRSPQRPPEWQVFQAEAYQHEHDLTQKPMLIVDWATPFSLGKGFLSDHGFIEAEKKSARTMARWLDEVFQLPFVVGVFKCQFMGSHPNDAWFFGKAKRTLVQDNGTDFRHMTPIMARVHRRVLKEQYRRLTKK